MVEGQDAGNEEAACYREALDVSIHVLLHQELKPFTLQWIGIFLEVGQHNRQVCQNHLNELNNSDCVDLRSDAEFSGDVT